MKRWSRWNSGLFAGILCCFVGSDSWCQSSFLRLDPPGSHLSISGPISVSGNSPVPLEDLPYGEYGVTGRGLGLPAIRGRLLHTADGTHGMRWAPAASLLYPPGLVHLDRGEARGWVFGAAGGAAGAMAIISQSDVGGADEKVERAGLAHSSAVSEDAIFDARIDLAVALREKADEEEVRDLWRVFLAASWIGAGVESLFLTPQPKFSSGSPGEYVALFPQSSAWKAGMSSALVPGSGQRGMGRNKQANFFALSVAALAGATIVAHDNFLEARSRQAEAQLRLNGAELEEEIRVARRVLQFRADEVSDKSSIRWAVAGVTAGVYFWNVLDAMRLGDRSSATGLTISVSPAADSGILAAASWELR